MYERMLDKQIMPTIEEMADYCGENADRFFEFNEWMTATFETEQQIVFPYGNNYGWGVAHRKKKKFLCNVFAENNAFTVMVRLTNKQYGMIYENLSEYTQKVIDNKYPCGDAGWIHYRVTCIEHLEDIKKLLVVKCN